MIYNDKCPKFYSFQGTKTRLLYNTFINYGTDISFNFKEETGDIYCLSSWKRKIQEVNVHFQA